MSLSSTEIQELITKLRQKYDAFASTHNPIWFNRDAFEERLQMAIKNRMNMEGFILSEISNFEKICEKYEEKKQKTNFSEKVDLIIEEHTARVKKHTPIEFHPSAGLEISHFYGAMANFSLHVFAILPVIINKKETRDLIYNLENSLLYLAMPAGSKHPRRIEDHIHILNRNNITEIEIDKDRTDYLKECAFILHEIMELCDNLLNQRMKIWEEPLRLHNIHIESKRKQKLLDNFYGTTTYGALLRVHQSVKDIIHDFRLQAFRRQKENSVLNR